MPLNFLYTGTIEITVLTCKMGRDPKKLEQICRCEFHQDDPQWASRPLFIDLN